MTPAQLEAELARIRGESERMQAELAELRGRPVSPHAKAMADFEMDHARRVEAGRAREAKDQAELEAYLNTHTREWLKITTDDPRATRIVWTESEDVLSGTEYQRATEIDWSQGHVQSGEVKPLYRKVRRTHELAGTGHTLVVRDEWSRRVSESESLASLVARGTLIATPLTAAECRAHERMLYKRNGARPMDPMASAAPTSMGPR